MEYLSITIGKEYNVEILQGGIDLPVMIQIVDDDKKQNWYHFNLFEFVNE